MMSKKGGFWDDCFSSPFGGLFDFNGDGVEDIAEEWLAYKMFQEVTKEEDESSDCFDFDSEDDSWWDSSDDDDDDDDDW